MEEQKQQDQESTKSPQHESSSPLQDSTKESPVTSSATSPPAATSANESNPTTSPESPSTQQQQVTSHEESPQQQQSPQQQSPQQQQQQQQQEQQLSEPVRTLKEAFPDIDVEVIEAILASQGGQMERSFEVLLGMSDPNYKPEEPPRPQQRAAEPTATAEDVPAPPMPPRPTQTETQTQAPYGYWQQQQQQQQPQEPRTVEEQMQMDEAYARQLALEDERVRAQRYQRQQQQAEDDQPLFNFQEDLPIIKERVVEAGNAAKKKVMDLYNQFKASRANNGGSPNQGTSMPTTNAQYRGLPSDDGDDLLAGDVSALHLSDNDVYAQTARPQQQQQPGVIHVNPPYQRQGGNDTIDAQIRADEELARRLAGDDQFWESNTRNNNNEQPPQMPPRKTPSPGVQHSTAADTGSEGDSVVLTAPETTKPTEKSESRAEERRSYVIRDEDDSDDDDLIDVDEESERKDATQKGADAAQKPDEKASTSPK